MPAWRSFPASSPALTHLMPQSLPLTCMVGRCRLQPSKDYSSRPGRWLQGDCSVATPVVALWQPHALAFVSAQQLCRLLQHQHHTSSRYPMQHKVQPQCSHENASSPCAMPMPVMLEQRTERACCRPCHHSLSGQLWPHSPTLRTQWHPRTSLGCACPCQQAQVQAKPQRRAHLPPVRSRCCCMHRIRKSMPVAL